MACATVSYRQSAISSVSSLHKAIRDGDFETMVEQIEEDPSLVSEPNSIGWTALHFCAASPAITLDTWKWVLQRVSVGPDVLLQLRTENGHNCVDHFFRLFLNPLEWQRHEVKEAAKDLKVAIQYCLENDDDHLQLLRQSLIDDDKDASLNEHMARVVPFWRRLQVLLQRLSYFELHALATTSCPRQVALLAIRLYPSNQRDSAGNLPLHLACRHEGAETIMGCLLEQASVLDPQGRLPLHLALASGKTWHHGIESLWNACPQYGGAHDEASFLLVPDEAAVQRATNRLAADTCGSLWRFMPVVSQQRALADAKSRIDLEHLSTVYELLRAAPNVLMMMCY